MSDAERLSKMKAQREAIRAHLAWLDGEIAEAEKHVSPEAATPTAGSSPEPVAPAPAVAAPTAPAPAAAVAATPLSPAATPVPGAGDPPLPPEFAHLEVRPNDIRNEVRKGCMIYLAVAIVLGLLGLGLLYLLFGRTDPMEKRRSAPPPSSSLSPAREAPLTSAPVTFYVHHDLPRLESDG